MWIVRVSLCILTCGAIFAQPSGDIARGQAIVEGKGNCLTCHRVKTTGSRLGPDLSEIGARRPEQLQASLLDPDAEILAANRTYRVVLKDGNTVEGRLLNQDTFTVQLLDTKENLRGFTKSDLRSFGIVEKSPMPSYKGRLTDQELGDVVAYLSSLKPPAGPGRGGRAATPAPATEPH